jgi:hypothetical protein
MPATIRYSYIISIIISLIGVVGWILWEESPKNLGPPDQIYDLAWLCWVPYYMLMIVSIGINKWLKNLFPVTDKILRVVFILASVFGAIWMATYLVSNLLILFLIFLKLAQRFDSSFKN